MVVLGTTMGMMGGRILSSESGEANFDTPVVAACSVQVEGCDQPSLDGSRQFFISHSVLAGACGEADLHVMRYATAGDARSVVATWCS